MRGLFLLGNDNGLLEVFEVSGNGGNGDEVGLDFLGNEVG